MTDEPKGPFCMNWPPSRGPMPDDMKPKFEFQPVDRQDFEFEQDQAAKEERGLLVGALLDKNVTKVICSPVLPTRNFIKRHEPRWSYPMKIRCDAHVETLAHIEVEQAIKLVVGVHDFGDEAREDKFTGRTRYWKFESYFEPKALMIPIMYPLGKGVNLTIKPYQRVWKMDSKEPRPDMTLGYILWCCAKEYERIYSEWKKYSVWGHSMDDLFFEGLILEGDGKANLMMGS